MQNIATSAMSPNPDRQSTSITNQTSSALRHHTPLPQVAIWTTKLSNASVNSFSGAMAGVASGIVTCPLDVIKTKLQANGSFSNPGLTHQGPKPSAIYQGMIGTAKVIIRQDGLKGLYRGLGPMLLGYFPTWAVYMTVYDGSREFFYTHGYAENSRDKWIARVYASIMAGGCSTMVTNPIWVIKTRMMSQVSKTSSDGVRTPWQYANTADAFRKMYRAEGLGVFYAGLAPAMLGLTHVAIQFPLYEYLKQKFTGVEMGATPNDSQPATNTFGILAATFISKVCATSATYPHEVLRTRLQTQLRSSHVEGGGNGVRASHHTQGISSSKRIGNTDGAAYQPRYTSLVQTFRTILREEGWRAFYNGMGTNMIRAVPAAMTTMLTFESVKGAIGRLQAEGKELQRDTG